MSWQTEPIVHRSGWTVQTNNNLFRGFDGGSVGVWFWHAWGPRGHQSGAETNADTATHKAYAASVVLADEKEKSA